MLVIYKKLSRHIFFSLFAIFTITISCKKEGNPNGLPTSIPESEYMGQGGDGVIRILAIGNSFSEDALESHLYELAKAEGKTVVIGNMYIGGASLQDHVKNVNNNASVYSYRKIGPEGTKKTYADVSVATAVADEKWDYISFQQVSQNSGQFNTYESTLPVVYNYVKERAKNPDVKYVLHQTWAYASNSTHSGFANYNSNQMTMYNAIVDAYNRAKTLINADLLVPSGTAIQNARTSVVGDNFTRDGYHLSIPMGRYTAAATWYETLFGKSVVGNAYKPAELSAFEASIAQNAAHYAVLKPNEVTPMVTFQGDGSFTGHININLGTAAAPSGWNGLTGFTAGSSVALKNNTNNYTGITATVTERFNGQNTDGATTTTTELQMPPEVSRTSYFGNSKGAFGGMTIVKSTIKVSGLDKSQTYNFAYFGSRMNVTDNRETKFTTKGANEVIVRLNTSNNNSNVVWANAVQPNEAGEITITVTSGEGNNNGTGFYYLSAIRITK
jgi:hypothetical protein